MTQTLAYEKGRLKWSYVSDDLFSFASYIRKLV